jgi:hypothetical protein
MSASRQQPTDIKPIPCVGEGVEWAHPQPRGKLRKRSLRDGGRLPDTFSPKDHLFPEPEHACIVYVDVLDRVLVPIRALQYPPLPNTGGSLVE